MTHDEALDHVATVVLVDEHNRPKDVLHLPVSEAADQPLLDIPGSVSSS